MLSGVDELSLFLRRCGWLCYRLRRSIHGFGRELLESRDDAVPVETRKAAGGRRVDVAREARDQNFFPEDERTLLLLLLLLLRLLPKIAHWTNSLWESIAAIWNSMMKKPKHDGE